MKVPEVSAFVSCAVSLLSISLSTSTNGNVVVKEEKEGGGENGSSELEPPPAKRQCVEPKEDYSTFGQVTVQPEKIVSSKHLSIVIKHLSLYHA